MSATICICDAPATVSISSHGARGLLCASCADQLAALTCPECDSPYVHGEQCPEVA